MKLFFYIFLAVCLMTAISAAQVPQIITHQGFLADSAGQPVNGTVPMTVRLFTDSLAGVPLYTENYDTVVVSSGVYNLGIHVNSTQFDSDRWLELEVNSATLTPRLRLTSVPFSYRADRAEFLSKGNSFVAPGDDGIAFTVGSIPRWQMIDTRLEPTTILSPNGLFVGINAGRVNTSNDNTIIGNDAGYSNIDGSENTFVGRRTGYGNESGIKNTFVGSRAGSGNQIGNYNSFFGEGAGFSNLVGESNSIFGQNAGYNNQASYNSFFGKEAGYSTTSGGRNAFFGYQAGFSNDGGNYNSFFGWAAGVGNASGNSNSFFGDQSGSSNSTGSGNSFFGGGAGMANDTGSNNSFFGLVAGTQNTDGQGNSFFGSGAGELNTVGNNNTHIGYQSGLGGSSDDNNATSLGYNATTTASNQVRIGNSSVTSIGGYANWTNISDGRFKTNVAEDVKGLDFILQLRPVTYNLDIAGLNRALHRDQFSPLSKTGSESAQMMAEQQSAIEAKSKIRQSGFVAQEVEQTAKALGYDFSGIDAPKNENDFYGLRYAEFVVPLVKAIQEQQAIIEQLKTEIEKLKSRIK